MNLVKLMKTLKTANRKQSQLVQGKLLKQINAMNLSLDAKRSAYRQVLRVAGHTDEEHINTLAEGYIR